MTESASLIYVVDDDPDLCGAVARLLARQGHAAKPVLDPALLLQEYASAPAHCIVTDVMMGNLDGFTFADRVRALDPAVALVFMTAWPTTANAVDSVRHHGGLDYLEKPLDEARLLTAVAEAVAWSTARRRVLQRTATLTSREREVYEWLTRGHSNKEVAAHLGLSPKTIEDHRAAIISKTGVNGLAQLIALKS